MFLFWFVWVVFGCFDCLVVRLFICGWCFCVGYVCGVLYRVFVNLGFGFDFSGLLFTGVEFFVWCFILLFCCLDLMFWLFWFWF